MTLRANLLRELTEGGVPEHEHQLTTSATHRIDGLIHHAVEHVDEPWLAGQMSELCADCAASDNRRRVDMWQQLERRIECRRAIDANEWVVLRFDDGSDVAMSARLALSLIRSGAANPASVDRLRAPLSRAIPETAPPRSERIRKEAFDG